MVESRSGQRQLSLDDVRDLIDVCWMAKRITEALTIPVIGIGAGNVTDGQILVMHDAFGITGGHIPKFAKNFLAEAGDIRAAVRQYIAEVESGVYPGEEHSFH